MPESNQQLAAKLRATASKIADLIAQRTSPLVAHSWVLESSPGLYLERQASGTYAPGGILSADRFNEVRAISMAAELRDPNQADVRATPVKLLEALAHELEETIALAELLEKQAA
jgi:hypothetical protein